MVFTKIEHARTAKEVESQVERLVLEGVLRAGDRLPGERELAKSLNVSRPIVREGLQALENRGLLRATHGDGTFVANVIGTIFAPPITKIISQNQKAKSDYLEYRREVEGVTAALAAQQLLDDICRQVRNVARCA